VAHNPDNFWNVRDALENAEVYSDFEGMAEITEDDKSWIRFFSRCYDLNAMQSDLLLHMVFEEKDASGKNPDSGQMHAYAFAITMLTTVKEWMKSDIDWDEIP